MPLCNGVDIGCVGYIDNITGRESGLTSLYGASHERTWLIGSCGKADDDSASCWCGLTRSGGMVRHRLAGHPPLRSPTPSAYRAGNEGKQMGQGASPATFADPLLQRQSSRRSTSDGKQRQENPRCGPRNLGHTREEDTGSTCTKAQGLSISAPTTCLHPEVGRQNDARARHSHDEGSSAASFVSARIRPRCLNQCCYKLLWVSSAAILRRRDGPVLSCTEKRKHAVDFGGRHQVLFRQNFTRLASGSCPDRPSHSPKVVEIRVHGKTRSSRNDGRDSPGWNNLPGAR